MFSNVIPITTTIVVNESPSTPISSAFIHSVANGCSLSVKRDLAVKEPHIAVKEPHNVSKET